MNPPIDLDQVSLAVHALHAATDRPQASNALCTLFVLFGLSPNHSHDRPKEQASPAPSRLPAGRPDFESALATFERMSETLRTLAVTLSATQTGATELFYLQHPHELRGKSVLWRAREGGYTTDICEARTFTREDVKRHQVQRGSDIPRRKAHVDLLAQHEVDYRRLFPDLAPSNTTNFFYRGDSFSGGDRIGAPIGALVSNLSLG